MSRLTVKLQLRLPYRNVWINWSSPWDKICSLIFLILFKRNCLGVWKLGQWRKKCVVVSVSLPQSYNGFRVSWKQCLNLWSRRWLRPRRNLVRSLIPYGLWTLKILFAKCRIKFNSFFLKNLKTSWVSNYVIKIFLVRYSRKKKRIAEIIVSCMNCRNIIVMSCFTNFIQVRSQIEKIWWRLVI